MDKNYYSISDETDTTLKDCVIYAPPGEFDDILKISHSKRVFIDNVCVKSYIPQRENAVDMNRECESVALLNSTIHSGKQNALTIKGGCKDILIRNLVIVPGSGNCDIELGGYSDQSFERVRNVRLVNVTRTDGKPVRLRVIHSDFPDIVGGNIEYQRFASLLAKIYWRVKKLFR